MLDLLSLGVRRRSPVGAWVELGPTPPLAAGWQRLKGPAGTGVELWGRETGDFHDLRLGPDPVFVRLQGGTYEPLLRPIPVEGTLTLAPATRLDFAGLWLRKGLRRLRRGELGPLLRSLVALRRAGGLRRLGTGAAAAPPAPGDAAVLTRPPLPSPPPKVSAIVPTRDQPALIDACLAGLLRDTDYPALEVVVVDNGSRDPEALAVIARWGEHPAVRVLRVDEPFNFARLCNLGAGQATGAVLALVNDDVRPLTGDWLKVLVAFVAQPDVGAVGPLLLYEDRTVQHAGVLLGLGGTAGHPWRGLPLEEALRRPETGAPQRRSAVTGACVVVRAEAYAAVRGMDEARFPVTFNDLDLCLKLGEAGLMTVYTPEARLLHLEGRSLPSDEAPDQRARRLAEANAFRERWGPQIFDERFPNGVSRESEAMAPR